MPQDTDTHPQPIIELDSLSTSSAILCSHQELTSLLFDRLADLSLNPVILLPRDSMTHPLPYVLLSQLETIKLPFDYLFVIFPSYQLTQDQLRFVLQLANRSHLKVIILDSQLHLKSYQLKKILAEYPNLDYRLCLVKDFYSTTPDDQIQSPLESFICHSLTGRLSLRYPQKNLYPTSQDQIIDGLLKATFKFSSFRKIYYLSSLDVITHLELSNLLKNHIPHLVIEQINSDHPLKDPSTKNIVATQAELDWYPDNELETHLAHLVSTYKPASTASSQLLNAGEQVAQTSLRVPSPQPQKPIPDKKDETLSVPVVLSRLGESLPTAPSAKTYKPLSQINTKPTTTINKAPTSSKEGTQPTKKPSSPISSPVSNRGRRLLGVSPRGATAFLGLILLLLVITSPVIGSIFLGSLAISSLKTALLHTSNREYLKAESELLSAENLFSQSRTLLTLFVPSRIIFSEKIDKYDRLLDSASKFVPIAKFSNHLHQNTHRLYDHITGQSQQPIDYETIRINIKDEAEDLYNKLVNLDLSLQRQDFDSSFADFQQLSEFKNTLPKLRQDLKIYLEFLNNITLFLNTAEVKNYLVLIQNTSELRPTGGFIEAAGVVTVKNGQILDYSYSDVYSLDQKLQGFVAPPGAIKKYLGEPNWFLRDSNWNPNFEDTAKQAIWFFEKQADRRVDGVIAIDTEIIKGLLEYLGPQELSGWDMVINHTNLYEKLLYQPKKDPQPGQEAKYLLIDLISAITQNLLKETRSGSTPNFPSALLNETHLQLYHKNPATQKQLLDSAFSGTTVDRPCFSKFLAQGCVSETFAFNEANVGINKVNYFVKRSIDHEISITSTGSINHKITLNYENTSPSTTWPGGDYKVYMRLNAPLGSQIISLSQDGQTIGLEDTKASGTLGLAEYSFPFIVKSGKNSQLVVHLKSPRVLSPHSPQSALTIHWEKQPGTTIDPIRLTFTYPETLRVQEINQKANVSPGRTQFLDQFAIDQSYALSFISPAK